MVYCAKFNPKNKTTKKQQKVEKDKKLVVGWRRLILSNTHLPPFLSNFLSILEILNFNEPGEKIVGLHYFSLPLPLSTKQHSHSFFLFFSTLFFPSSLKSTQPNIP